ELGGCWRVPGSGFGLFVCLASRADHAQPDICHIGNCSPLTLGVTPDEDSRADVPIPIRLSGRVAFGDSISFRQPISNFSVTSMRQFFGKNSGKIFTTCMVGKFIPNRVFS